MAFNLRAIAEALSCRLATRYHPRWPMSLLQPFAFNWRGVSCRVIWPYDEEGKGTLPDHETGERLREFEALLSATLENDARAIVAAVVTFDGARQWVAYTTDSAECTRRMQLIFGDGSRFPLDIDAFPDPSWSYLRDEVLLRVRESPS